MPCEGGGYGEAARELREATQVACELARLLRRGGKKLPSAMTKLATKWIAEHDEIDRRRRRDERDYARRNAIAAKARKKLTKQELDALRYGV